LIKNNVNKENIIKIKIKDDKSKSDNSIKQTSNSEINTNKSNSSPRFLNSFIQKIECQNVTDNKIIYADYELNYKDQHQLKLIDKNIIQNVIQ